MKYDLSRFIKAQKQDYDKAFLEIKSGKKLSHWMWYIFPQLKGLGVSSTSNYYGINDLYEAKMYLDNDYLCNNLINICRELIVLEDNVINIFGYPDCYKLQSSMTLFYMVNKDKIFKDVIDKFYNGEFDKKTFDLIKENHVL